MKRNKKILDCLSLMLVVMLLVGLISFSVVSQISESVARAEADASVVLDCLTEAPIYFGDTVELYATVTGISSKYTLEWQYNDGEHGWHVLEDASGVSYKYVVTEENVNFGYRVVAYIKADNVPEEGLEALYGEKTEPFATEAPVITEAPTAETTVTESPAATETPKPETTVTETPVITENPTAEPVATEAPVATELPTAEPVATEAPVVTEAPKAEPVATEAPVTTEAPKAELVETETPTETQKTESTVSAAEQKQEIADTVPATEE